MEKKTLAIGGVAIAAIIIIVLVITIPLMTPALTIKGTGVSATKSLTLSDIKSSSYEQVTDAEFDWTSKVESSTSKFSGVVIASLLEVSGILPDDTAGLTITFRNKAGDYEKSFDLDEIIAAGSQCILAYGGADFDAADDGNLKLIIDQDFFGPGIMKNNWVSDVAEIEIA